MHHEELYRAHLFQFPKVINQLVEGFEVAIDVCRCMLYVHIILLLFYMRGGSSHDSI